MRTWKTLLIALSLTLGAGFAAPANAAEPFADLDNDGVFSDGDVVISDMLADNGYFSTDEDEGAYTAPGGTVGIVVPSRLSVRTRALVLVASGDISVHGHLNASGQGAVIFLMSTGGSVHVDDKVKVSTASILQIVAAGDVWAGERTALRAKDKDFSLVSVASANGDVVMGAKSNVGAKSLVEIVTSNETGGDVKLGSKSRVLGGNATRVTAGGQLEAEGVRMSGRSIVMGSRSGDGARAAGGAGMTSITGSRIRSRSGSVHIFAEGQGGLIDLTGTQVDAPQDAVTLDADVIVQ